MPLSAGSTAAHRGASELPEKKNPADGGGGGEKELQQEQRTEAPFKEMCSTIPTETQKKKIFFQ